jgi:hypothetical protein
LIFPGLVAIAMDYLGPSPPPPGAAPAFWRLVIVAHPYYLIRAPYADPAKVNVDLATYLSFLGGCPATSAGLVGLATSRIRRVALRQAGSPAAGPRRRWMPRLRRPRWLPVIPGPSLDDNPVAWREWHRMRPSRMMRLAWGLYAALGVLWFGLALNRSGPLRMLAQEQGMMVGFQVALGLLLISVSAATGLAEERVRGSLDVLLSTPMSTRSILAGKWWGTFRQVGSVAFWPALLGGRMLLFGGSLFNYLLLVGSVLASGAAITSLGLALATGVSRVGRAVASCVTVYVAFSIGWTLLIVMLCSPEPLRRSLVIGSPAIGALAGMQMVSPDFSPPWRVEYRFAATLWLLVYVAVASGLFAATVASFDRCLGRMPEDGEPPLAGGGRPSRRAGLLAGDGPVRLGPEDA